MLAGLGIVFGVALAIVAARFVVKVDPKVEQVRETLPGANCGACGFAGCMGYAEAVVGNPDVAVNMCAPGKSAVAEKIAEITGKKAEKVDPKIARVFCQGGNSLSQRKFIYTGVRTAPRRCSRPAATSPASTDAWDTPPACAPAPSMRSR